MSMGQDGNPDWRQVMQGQGMQGQGMQNMPLLNQPVGNLDFAGIASPQQPVPGIAQLLAQIPDAKTPKHNRADRLALNAYAEHGAPLPARLVGASRKAGSPFGGNQGQRAMNRRSQGSHR